VRVVVALRAVALDDRRVTRWEQRDPAVGIRLAFGRRDPFMMDPDTGAGRAVGRGGVPDLESAALSAPSRSPRIDHAHILLEAAHKVGGLGAD
jgi:hypothetical protein